MIGKKWGGLLLAALVTVLAGYWLILPEEEPAQKSPSEKDSSWELIQEDAYGTMTYLDPRNTVRIKGDCFYAYSTIVPAKGSPAYLEAQQYVKENAKKGEDFERYHHTLSQVQVNCDKILVQDIKRLYRDDAGEVLATWEGKDVAGCSSGEFAPFQGTEYALLRQVCKDQKFQFTLEEGKRNWVLLKEDAEGGRSYADKGLVFPYDENTVHVLMKFVPLKDSDMVASAKEMIKELDRNPEAFDHLVQVYRMHCKDGKARLLAVFFCNPEGKIIAEYKFRKEKESPEEDVPSGSHLDMLKQFACGKAQS